MKAQYIDLKRFITASDMIFVIPVYQRNYDWKKENCKRLFEDTCNIVKTGENHFIGTICHKMDGRNKSVIIDGQQRITSTMLLIKALFDSIEDVSLKRKLKNQYLINEYGSDELKIKLKPIKKDENVFVKLIKNDVFDENNFDDYEKTSNIYRNYNYFKELLKARFENGLDADDFINAIERLEIVELELDKENPQVIFESLNSIGLDLTNTDLLRNYLLMSLDYHEQEILYTKYWLQIENIMKTTDMMEQFMTHYLIFKRKSDSITNAENKKSKLNSKTLYYAFKKEYPNIDGNESDIIENCLNDMYKYAKIYSNFIFDENSTYPKDALKQKLYTIFKLLEERDSAIFLMFLFDKYNEGCFDEEKLCELLDICISLIFRADVCGNTGFDKQFSALSIQNAERIIKSDADWTSVVYKTLTSGKGSYAFPLDKTFKNLLETKDLYNSLKSKKCKYMLYCLERFFNKKELPEYSQGSVEHIMPQNDESKEWIDYLNSKMDLMNRDYYLHTLGNLTISGYNSEESDKLFDLKKDNYYVNSNYTITRQLTDYKDWTSKEIKNRADKLSKAALLIWKLPIEYNKEVTADTGITYNLNSDLSSFKGHKPDTIYISGTQKQIVDWVEFQIEIAKTFYELDKGLFLELLAYDGFSSNRLVISTKKEGMVAPREFVKDLYIETNNPTQKN